MATMPNLRPPVAPIGCSDAVTARRRSLGSGYVGPGNEAFPRAIETSGAGSALLVPLRKDDALLGLISAGRKEVRAFTEKQIALLRTTSCVWGLTRTGCDGARFDGSSP
jgi:GAF domain-containing protein